MNIAQIRALDIGMGGITCVGTVGFVGDKQNITGSKNNKDYDFWSQFLTLKDETGTIGVSISAKSESLLLGREDKEKTKTVEKCTLKSYIKDNQTQLKLQGYLLSPPQGTEQPQNTQQGSQQAAQSANAEKSGGNAPESNDRLIVAQTVYASIAAKFASVGDFDIWLTKYTPTIKRHIDIIMQAADDDFVQKYGLDQNQQPLDSMPQNENDF